MKGHHTPHSIESRLKISQNRKGKLFGVNNHKWNGGISLYREYIEIKECEKCKSKNRLIVHHKDGNRINNEITNLQVLCYRCHSEVHKHFNRWEGHKKVNCFCGKIGFAKGLCRYHYQIEYRKV